MAPTTRTRLNHPVLVQKTAFPAVLTVAGSDNSGGAGVEADIKTFTAHGVYGLTCVTALTAQNTQLVDSFVKTPSDHLKRILERNWDDFIHGYGANPPLKAVKTGMLSKEAILVLLEYLELFKKYEIRLVVDPVMVSTTGSDLVDEEAMSVSVKTLLKDAFLVTPNFVEAKSLYRASMGSEMGEVANLDDFTLFTKNLQNAIGCENVLVKGGHIPWNKARNGPAKPSDEDTSLVLDILYESKTDSITVFELQYVKTSNTHGTGCTLSSAIAANIAKGLKLTDSVALAIDYVHRGILSLENSLGHGHGPLDHTVRPLESLGAILAGPEGPEKPLIDCNSTVLDYFKSHSLVKPNWLQYTEHRFLQELSSNSLLFDKFLYFLKQDFYYLVNYAQIHALAASAAPTYQEIHSESLIIGNIVKEIERHKAKLSKEYDIDYDKADLDAELQPGKACLEYCQYLLHIGKTENYLGIKVALSPCLFGYAEAGRFGAELRKKHNGSLGNVTKDQAAVYDLWLADYTSDWYQEAYDDGMKALQHTFEGAPISQQRLDELTRIFNKVTCLEVAFWTEVLERK